MPRSRKTKLIFAAVIAVALLLLAPWLVPARAYRARVEASLGRALGRTVTLDDVSVHLFPRPGLTLANLVIGEDPAFGPEPMLLAPEVTVDVRLASLLRGRLEFSSLSAKDASFNLVRRADGEWSMHALMQRTSHSATPATANHAPEVPYLFPYLEATNSRVNFKDGIEKKPFALVDADFALWPDGGAWHARLRARPIRADANLSDMGTVRAEGVLRPQSGNPAAISAQASWEDAQLGQSSALFFGHDRGWRGATAAEVSATGTVESLDLAGKFSVTGFHRYDIAPSESLQLSAACTGNFSLAKAKISGIDCKSAAGDGLIAATADIEDLWGKHNFSLAVKLDSVPVERLAAFARNAKKDLPADLTADGMFSGEFQVSRNIAGAFAIVGGGIAHQLILRSAASESTLPLETIAFQVRPATVQKNGQPRPAYQLVAEPFAVPLGGEVPAQASAVFDTRNYQIELTGPVRLPKLQAVAGLLGMRPPAYSLQGSANLRLQIAGSWAGFAPPLITGEAQLADVATDALGVSAPLRLSARLILQADSVRMENLVAGIGQSGPRFTGQVSLPRGCAHPEDCEARFALRSASLSLDELFTALKPAAERRAWYQFGSATPAHPALARLRATGQLSCQRVTFQSLRATDASAMLTLDGGRVRVANVRARMLGGRHRGEWRADLTMPQPQYEGSGTLEGVNMAQLAELMGDDWASGTAAARYQVRFAGRTREQMLASASGEAGFEWRDGTLRHVTLPSTRAGLRFADFRGRLRLDQQNLSFLQSRITTAGGIYEMSGTASLDRTLALSLTRGKNHGYALGGTLAEPRVTDAQVSLTEAHSEAGTAVTR